MKNVKVTWVVDDFYLLLTDVSVVQKITRVSPSSGCVPTKQVTTSDFNVTHTG